MLEIFLVRHGETFAKTSNNKLAEPFVCGSGSEISRNTTLTPAGEEGMRQVGENFTNTKFDLVVISDLVRSRQSAENFLKGAGQENLINDLIIDVDVTEINYGEDDGASEEKVKVKKKKFFTENPDKNGDLTFAFPGAESFAEAGKRMRMAILEISKKHFGKKVLIVSHSGSMRALIGNVIPGQDLKFGEVIKLKSDGEKISIL